MNSGQTIGKLIYGQLEFLKKGSGGRQKKKKI